MKRSRLGFRFLAPLVLVCGVSIAIMAGAAGFAMKRLNERASASTLRESALALARTVPDSSLQEYCRSAAAGTRFRITVIDMDGSVVGDSGADPARMENHAQRPEVRSALRGEPSLEIRQSDTMGVKMAYAAVPFFRDGRQAGVLRLALDTPTLANQVSPFYFSAAVAALVLAAAAGIGSIQLGKRLTRPVSSLLDASKAWSSGNLRYRMAKGGDAELDGLADAMNAMSRELESRIDTMEAGRRELSALLNGMSEAVLATDADLRLVIANPKARELFLIPENFASGPGSRSLLEMSRQPSLETLALACLDSRIAMEDEFVLYGEGPRTFTASASPVLWDDNPAGVVIVLNDISRLKRLETIRKDFVANVSHELRTPITLIKGFAETLEGGALEAPEDARRFLGIIKRNADRMSALIEDLLMLAQLESPDRGGLETSDASVIKILSDAVEAIQDKAAPRGIRLLVSCPDDFSVRVNQGLVEQAIINLLENAIKYGKQDSTVTIDARIDGAMAMISVQDEGPGIPAADASRLFERFYRVDRARSRDIGGTGLGLAIVKHIALAHGGDVKLQTQVGTGSTFSLIVPRQGFTA